MFAGQRTGTGLLDSHLSRVSPEVPLFLHCFAVQLYSICYTDVQSILECHAWLISSVLSCNVVSTVAQLYRQLKSRTVRCRVVKSILAGVGRAHRHAPSRLPPFPRFPRGTFLFLRCAFV